ncbi:hypothetical protein DL764_010152 [Monosporascus ibericus]|uniref:prephenate dehydratase n=1 Tax=Monosporascus ibericus TaxID=155417 RepID=A0A4Q4SW04_9PEZI|nr:hypothetical protein DL764_010152 [Monosporascus ibericus]
MATSSDVAAGTGGATAPPDSAKPVVCFLGPVASYTHQATLQAFPTDKFKLMSVVTIEDIFDTTQSGRAAYGVVPFENSTNGSVVFTLDCFADRAGAYRDLSVCAEIYQDVHHCLVGRRRLPRRNNDSDKSPTGGPPQSPSQGPSNTSPNPSAPTPLHHHSDPDPDLSHIRRVYSHPQAFGQCTRFLGTRLRGVETVDVSSTSRAAEMARSEDDGASAAVSSAAAAEMLGLDVLARNIEDRPDNTTRFFVLRRGTGEEGSDVEGLLCRGAPRRRQRDGASGSGGGPPLNSSGTFGDSDSGDAASTTAAAATATTTTTTTKSLVSFTVPHRSPGALADVLDCFRRTGLNLTSISSRPNLLPLQACDEEEEQGTTPTPTPSFQYVFFVEFEGHRFRDPEGRVRDALAGVAAAARAWRWLGSWENKLVA